MSFQDYEAAIRLIEDNADLLTCIGTRPKELIQKAEERLGLSFPMSYKEFLLKFGAMSFGAEEIYGIVREDFDNSRVPDAIWFTLVERKQVNLPNHLLVIYDTGSEELYCLDFSRLNSESEPAVVVFVPGVDLEYQRYEVISSDFGEFLLRRIKWDLTFRERV